MKIPNVDFRQINLRAQGFASLESSYVYNLDSQVSGWQIKTFGIQAGHDGPVSYTSEISLSGRIVYRRTYIIDQDAETGHVSLTGLCSVAESQEELLTFIRMAEAHVPGSETTG